jgi:predicted glycosyltransferase
LKILIGIQHPKQVHLFKNTIFQLVNKGHDVKIVAIDKEITRELLERLHIPFTLLGENQPTLGKKFWELLSREYKTFNIIKEFKPDLVIGRAVPHLAHVSAIFRIPFIIFEDTELAGAIHKITIPFASTIVTPSSYLGNFGEKHVRYNGYDELSYLHPNYFIPDPQIFKNLGLDEGDPFIVLRFISWNAYHDVNLKGIADYPRLIRDLEPYGKVFVSAEGRLDPSLEKYRIQSNPEKMHSLLYYAQLYIGEGGTMAVEAAILGTPSIHVEGNAEGIATGNLTGNFRELRDKYGLLFYFAKQEEAFSKALEILKNSNAKPEWQKKRDMLLKDKIDVTEWMTDFIEKYPDSFDQYKKKNRTS